MSAETQTKLVVPPTHWGEEDPFEFPLGSGNFCAKIYVHRLINKMTVLRSISFMENGDNWIHVSVSRPDRIPSWEEIAKVKSEFIGDELEAVHVIPKSSDHINVHAYCMHLWAPIKTTELPNLKKLVKEEAA